ncbi:MAG TPA: DUF5715 family protein [Streptosporangiaceae bacterium]|nr:DUF5715 family protein [Streptosporangiaceae bacterium]
MTIWLASGPEPGVGPTAPGGAAAGYAPAQEPDLTAYRSAVTDLVASFERSGAGTSARMAQRFLSGRIAAPDLAAVLARTPQGTAGALERLRLEIQSYRPSARSSATSLASLTRISLLAQIDAMWWGRQPAFPTDDAVLDAPELLDLDALAQGGLLRFRYRHQASSLVGRAARSVERRALPGRRPMTAGLWLARARPQAVALLNQIAARFAELAPPGTPPLWVTSLARSVEHQRRLRALGYAALLPSSHCVGYAADVEMAWFRRFGAHQVLQQVLLEQQATGDVNVIDEGQAWHVCLRPGVSYGSRLMPPDRTGG